jgi:hypothetical protein
VFPLRIMKTNPVPRIGSALALALLLAGTGAAGECQVEVKTPEGRPRQGAEVQVAMEDGEKTVPVKTNRAGVAILAWKTDVRKGRILVDGSARYAGPMPIRISFRQ